MNCINKVAKIYGKISRDIVFWLQHLQGKEPKKI